MNVFLTAVNIAGNFVMALCFTLVAIFIVLAYFDPMNLDALVHQAHDLVPAIINGVIDNIKSLF